MFQMNMRMVEWAENQWSKNLGQHHYTRDTGTNIPKSTRPSWWAAKRWNIKCLIIVMTLVSSFATFNCTTKYTLLDWRCHQMVVEHWPAGEDRWSATPCRYRDKLTTLPIERKPNPTFLHMEAADLHSLQKAVCLCLCQNAQWHRSETCNCKCTPPCHWLVWFAAPKNRIFNSWLD